MSNELIKYPRTPHLPQSLGMTSDDKMMSSAGLKNLQEASDLVVTEKMDGGNITLTRDHFFARSLDSGTQLWDTQAKAIWAALRFDIPKGWRVSAESLYAARSVRYTDLPGPILVFGMWNDSNEMLAWDDIEEWSNLLGLPTAPVIYRGGDYAKAISAWAETHDRETSEGFVVRNATAFHYDNFGTNVAKYVRANHVQTSAGWRGRDDFALNGIAT